MFENIEPSTIIYVISIVCVIVFYMLYPKTKDTFTDLRVPSFPVIRNKNGQIVDIPYLPSTNFTAEQKLDIIKNITTDIINYKNSLTDEIQLKTNKKNDLLQKLEEQKKLKSTKSKTFINSTVKKINTTIENINREINTTDNQISKLYKSIDLCNEQLEWFRMESDRIVSSMTKTVNMNEIEKKKM